MNILNKTNFLQKFHLDGVLFFLISICFIFSLLILYSANLDIKIIEKQAIRLLLAMSVMFIFAQIPPRILFNWTTIFYAFTLIMLLLVLLAGDVSKGAQRWLDLKIIRFQPSELMKIAVPLMVAKSLTPVSLPPKKIDLILPTLYVIVPTILIAMQPDLGTAILVASSGCFVIFFAGIRWKFILSLFGMALAFTPIFWFFGLKTYQKERILTLLNPEKDPLGKGYHIIQSKIAIGSGGIFGKGWLQGTQSNLEFLPERTTDFIFSVFSEEFGLIGFLVLSFVYMLIILRGLHIGVQAQDTFTRLVSGSIITTFFIYVFVNIGMVSGILPVVGIPLPLISYGGTSLVTIMLSFGILMSIHTHRTLLRK